MRYNLPVWSSLALMKSLVPHGEHILMVSAYPSYLPNYCLNSERMFLIYLGAYIQAVGVISPEKSATIHLTFVILIPIATLLSREWALGPVLVNIESIAGASDLVKIAFGLSPNSETFFRIANHCGHHAILLLVGKSTEDDTSGRM